MNGAEGTQHSALLIGVGNYSNPELPPLAGPSVDLRSMKAALEHPQIGGYTVSTLEDVDSSSACTRIEEFLGTRAEDETVVLFYSGHGFIDRRGSLYLCTTNSSFATPRASSIRADFVTDLIDNCASHRVLLLLDCCYSGNFEGAAKASSVIEPQFKGTGLGRVVLTAGAGDQLAWDLGAQGSLFSRHIVRGLTTGAADLDQDGRITVQELYDYVYREVTREQPRQRPGKWTYKEDGPSFLIAQSPIQPKRELPPELLKDLDNDFPRARVAVLRELESFVRRQAWARDPVVEKVRSCLADDSDSVKMVAREILERMTGGAAHPPLQPTNATAGRDLPPPAVASKPTRQRTVKPARPAAPGRLAETERPAEAKAHKREAQPAETRAEAAPSFPNKADSALQPEETEWPLKHEVILWILAALLTPLVLLPLGHALVPTYENYGDEHWGHTLVTKFATPLAVVGFGFIAVLRYRLARRFADVMQTWLGRSILLVALLWIIAFALMIRNWY